jgi:hypothetical protein
LRIIKLWAEFMGRDVDEKLIIRLRIFDNRKLITPFLPDLRESYSFGEMECKFGVNQSTLRTIWRRNYNEIA